MGASLAARKDQSKWHHGSRGVWAQIHKDGIKNVLPGAHFATSLQSAPDFRIDFLFALRAHCPSSSGPDGRGIILYGSGATMDVLLIAIEIIFFAAMAGYVALCAKA